MASNKLKEVVIDIQGLVGPADTFIPKEIAVLSVQGNYIGHWFIAPPCLFSELPFSARRQNYWLTANFHRIEWEYGYTPHKLVNQILREATRNVSRIYVRGREKVIFLQRILSRTIVNLETYSPPLKRLPENKRYCVYHAETNLHGDYVCALHNATKLKIWIRANIYSGKITLREEDVSKIWSVDSYRISQVTAHEASTDEDEGVESLDSDDDRDTLPERTYHIQPVQTRRLPKDGEDVCGTGAEPPIIRPVETVIV